LQQTPVIKAVQQQQQQQPKKKKKKVVDSNKKTKTFSLEEIGKMFNKILTRHRNLLIPGSIIIPNFLFNSKQAQKRIGENNMGALFFCFIEIYI
jgi:hypothetical protein